MSSSESTTEQDSQTLAKKESWLRTQMRDLARFVLVLVSLGVAFTILEEAVDNSKAKKAAERAEELAIYRQTALGALATARWTTIGPGEEREAMDGSPELYELVDQTFGINYMDPTKPNIGEEFLANDGYFSVSLSPATCSSVTFSTNEAGLGPKVKLMHTSASAPSATAEYATRTLAICNTNNIEQNYFVLSVAPGTNIERLYSE